METFATDRIVCQNTLETKRRSPKTASIILGGGRSKTVQCRTIKNRAPWWVVARDTYGHERVVYKTRHEDSARMFHGQRVEANTDYTVSVVCNIIEWE